MLLPATPASAASACASGVLRDWSEDGQVAPRYSPPCYEEAIDALPADLRDYTDAEDVIARALSRAVRAGKGQPVAPVRGSEAPIPVSLLGLVGAVLALLAAGFLGHVFRHRSGARPGQADGRR